MPEIRTKTLRKITIKHAFEHAGMWPVNSHKVLEKMSKYMREEATPEPELPALPPPETPRTTHEFRAKWSNLQPKLQNLQNQLSTVLFGTQYHGLITRSFHF